MAIVNANDRITITTTNDYIEVGTADKIDVIGGKDITVGANDKLAVVPFQSATSIDYKIPQTVIDGLATVESLRGDLLNRLLALDVGLISAQQYIDNIYNNIREQVYTDLNVKYVSNTDIADIVANAILSTDLSNLSIVTEYDSNGYPTVTANLSEIKDRFIQVGDAVSSFTNQLNANTTAVSSAVNLTQTLTARIDSPDTGLLANADAIEDMYSYVGYDREGSVQSTGLASTVQELVVGVSALTNQIDGSVMIHALNTNPVSILAPVIDTAPTYNKQGVTETLAPLEAEYGGFKAVLYTTVNAPTLTSTDYYSLSLYLHGLDRTGTLNGRYTAGTLCVMKVYVDGGLDSNNNTVWTLGYVGAPIALPSNKSTGVDFGSLSPTNFIASTKPLNNKEPYKSWYESDLLTNDEAVRSVHVGDTFVYINSSGQYVKSFKFVQSAVDSTKTDNQGYAWYEIKDSIALIAATQAHALADGKMKVYSVTPEGPYQTGDLWVKNIGQSQQQIWTATTTRDAGFNAADWTLSATDDTLVSSFLLDGNYLDLSKAAVVDGLNTVSFSDYLNTELDKVVNVYSGTDAPTSHNFNSSLLQDNDIYLWFTSGTTGSGVAYDYTRTYKRLGTTWSEITSNENLTALADLADGKRTVFGGSTLPTNGQANDIWIPATTISVGSGEYLAGEMYSGNTDHYGIPINNILSNINTGTAIRVEITGTFNGLTTTMALNSSDYPQVSFPLNKDELVALFKQLLVVNKNSIIDGESTTIESLGINPRLKTVNGVECIIVPNLLTKFGISASYSIFNVGGTPSFIGWNDAGQLFNFVTTVKTNVLMWDISTRYSSNISNLITDLNENIIPGLQEQLDGQVDYYFYNSSYETLDTISNYTNWNDGDKLSHQGDLAYDTYTETGYYYDRNLDNGTWVEINSTTNLGVIQALKNASTAQATADSKMSLYFAVEVSQNLNPGVIDNIKYWFFNGALKRISDNSVVTAKTGDELKTVVITGTTKDYLIYTYNELNGWLLNTPNGLVAKSGWAIDLDGYLKDPSTGTFGGTSTLSTEVKTKSDGVVETAFNYSTGIKPIGGKYHSAGFGLHATTGGGTLSNPYNSEFWIEASKFRLSSGATAVPVFTVDTTTNQAIFNGKVVFNGSPSTLEHAVQNYVEQVSVGDKNINITDNLIPLESLVTDTNNAGYQFIGSPTKGLVSGLSTFAEPQIILDGTDEVYSPYLEELGMAYYYRVGIKGITSLNRFKIVTINGTTVVNNDITYTLNSGITLNSTDWYEIDGIINPSGGNTSSSGSIRTSTGVKIGTINNFALPVGTTKLVLGWISNCTISRIKIAKITADTLTGNYTTQDYVDSVVTTNFATLQETEEARDGLISVFYQVSAPSVGIEYGDYWLDIDDVASNIYRYENATNKKNITPLTWNITTSATAISIKNAYLSSKLATTAKSTADSKTATFYSTTVPTSISIGDLWIKTDTNKYYKAMSVGATTISSTGWVLVQDITDIAETIAETAVSTKSSTFYQSSIPVSTAIGDIWIDSDSGIMYRAAIVGANEAKDDEWEEFNADFLTIVNDLVDDSKLTASEKQAVKREWETIVAEKASLVDQAALFEVSSVAYTSKYNALDSYLNTPVGSALLTSLVTTSDIVSSTFTTTFKEYYTAKIDLLNALAAKARTLANDAQSTADGKMAASDLNDELAKTTTVINGGRITTGKIESMDGNTYFDLNNNQIKMNNGTFILNSTAAGTSSSPNIQGAYIKGSIIDSTSNITSPLLYTSNIQIISSTSSNCFCPISYSITSGSFYGSSYSTGFLSRRISSTGSYIVINAIAKTSFNGSSGTDPVIGSITAALQYSIDGGSSWVTIDDATHDHKSVYYLRFSVAMPIAGIIQCNIIPVDGSISFRVIKTTGNATLNSSSYLATLHNQ